MKCIARAWLFLLCAAACSGNGTAGAGDADVEVFQDVSAEDVAGEDGELEVELPEQPAMPVLTPCPNGWVEVPPEDDDGVATCDPWPDGDPVTLPILTPCPEGWREVPVTESGDVMGCDPYPEGGAHECGAYEAHFPGEPECTRIGTPCPEGNWAEDLPPDGEVLYVLAGAGPGGDGTRESPFDTIAEAMDAATEGTTIALSKGVFDEEVFLLTGVTLLGACVAETLVTCSERSESEGTVMLRGTDTEIRNLRISGDRAGIWVSGPRSVHVEDVVIDSAEYLGWLVMNGGRATGRSIVVRNTRARASDGMFGRGLDVENGAQVDVSRALFERNRHAGVLAGHAGTILNMTDIVVRETQSRENDMTGGRGLVVQDGAQVNVSRALFERNREVGIFAALAGTILNMADVVVRDTQYEESDRTFGRGLHVQEGARADVTRALFERNREVGVFTSYSAILNMTDVVVRETQSRENDRTGGRGLNVQEGAQADVSRALFEKNREVGVIAGHAGTMLNMTDVVVRDTRSRESDMTGGQGLEVSSGAQADVSRALFEKNREIGVIAGHDGTILNMTDIVVRDTQYRESDRMFGFGLDVQEGAQVDVSRALFERNRAVGVIAFHAGTMLNMTDIVVRETQSRESDRIGGLGLNVENGAQVDVSRALFERNRHLGVLAASSGTILNMTDVVVRETQSREIDGMFGRGLHVQEGGQVDVSRALFERNREVGVLAAFSGTILNITDIVVRETLERECASDTCAGFGAGTGISSIAKAHIDVTRFIVSHSALCGIQLAHGVDELGMEFPAGGTIDLHHGVVSDNRIGVNIQTEGFDIYRLMDMVIYRDNDRNLDTSELPVPEMRVEELETGP